MAEYGDVLKQKIQDALGSRAGVKTIFRHDEIMAEDIVELSYRCMSFVIKVREAQDLSLCQAVKKFADDNNIDVLEIPDKEIIDVITRLRPEKPKDGLYCAKCWELIRKTDNYCPNCGTRIDWGDEDEKQS